MSIRTILIEFHMSGEPFPIRVRKAAWITEELIGNLVELVAQPEEVYAQVFKFHYDGSLRRLIDLVSVAHSQRNNVQMKLLRGINAVKR